MNRYTLSTLKSIFTKKHDNFYDYSLINEFLKQSVKLQIICPLHGIFFQTAKDHLKGSGCPKCGDNRTAQKLSSNKIKFVQKANKIHDNKYNYNKFIYSKANVKSIITCLIHGDFKQSPNKHLMDRGCPKCGRISTMTKRRLNPDVILDRFNKKHNFNYSYPNFIYKGDNIKIEIGCPQHGIFYCTPNNHARGKGCPKCSGKYKTTQEAKNLTLSLQHFAIYINNLAKSHS